MSAGGGSKARRGAAPLRNDCFALPPGGAPGLPPGVHWTPVDEALATLRARLHPVVGIETLPVTEALGRVLAEDLYAPRSHPPRANSAVDGYGVAGGRGAGPHRVSLTEGRAAAGCDYEGEVPAGQALRILTGAALPKGVDTVVLEEDTERAGDAVLFTGPLKQGANVRHAGEDLCAGDLVLRAGRVITPGDLASACATGVTHLPLRKPLRVGVLSTGDELVEAGAADPTGTRIYDANRPMLLALLRQMGLDAVDLGMQADDRDQLRDAFQSAAGQVDVLITSGGASGGDEDHVSALLRAEGQLHHWRIALKPGRPLVLAQWPVQGAVSGPVQGPVEGPVRGGVQGQGEGEGEGHTMPVFGLPGNPVAAMVCALVFLCPSMRQLSGAAWVEPQGFDVPAAFEKRKKPGRREYLRARMRAGRAEVFASEGSGRISGLSWAEGLVELPDAVAEISPGDPVRFSPYQSFLGG